MSSRWMRAAVVTALLAGVLGGCEGRTPINPTRLTDDPGDETAPAFSPDGKSVAYGWAAGEGAGDIWVIDLETRKKRRMTRLDGVRNSRPAWSHDGKWIAFHCERDARSDIWVASAQTEEAADAAPARVLTKDAGTNRVPTWSPDDSLLAFESDRNGRFDIWVMKADGTDAHVLTRSASHDTDPAWSPDGKLIAFSSGRTGNPDIWIMNPDGSHPRRVTTDPADERRPRWTPDSAQLVYMAEGGGDCREFRQVFRTGKGAKQLFESSASIRDPVVSPDGRWLAFSSNHEGTYDIYLLGLDN